MKPTQEELIKAGEKAFAQRERDKLKTQARYEAVKRLISAHQPEFLQYLTNAQTKLGV